MYSPHYQKHWNVLTQALQQSPYAQSWLFWEEKSANKNALASFAENLAAWLLCEEKKVGWESACGKCASCHWFQAKTHPDYLKLSPTTSEIISVDAVRQIQAFSEQKSHQGQYRIIVISPAEAMNISAANALLKILEEPFEQTLFFLTSQHFSWILPTIRSRCQKIYFSSDEAETTLPGQSIVFDLMKKNIAPQAETFIKVMKDNDLSFDLLIDNLLLFIHEQIVQPKTSSPSDSFTHLSASTLYKLYDKLIIMKHHLQQGYNINPTIWLEDFLHYL